DAARRADQTRDDPVDGRGRNGHLSQHSGSTHRYHATAEHYFGTREEEWTRDRGCFNASDLTLAGPEDIRRRTLRAARAGASDSGAFVVDLRTARARRYGGS